MKKVYFHRFPYWVVLYFLFCFYTYRNGDNTNRESHGDIGDAQAGNIVLCRCLVYVGYLWSV